MWTSMAVFVAESTPENAKREAVIQCEERKEIDQIADNFFVCPIKEFGGIIAEDGFPFFLLNAVTGEFQSFVGESPEYRRAVFNEWLEPLKEHCEFEGSGIQWYLVICMVDTYLLNAGEEKE